MALFDRGKEKKAMEEAKKAAEEATARAQKAENELKAMKDEKAKKDFFAKQKEKSMEKPVPGTMPGPGGATAGNVTPGPTRPSMAGMVPPSVAGVRPAASSIIAEYTVKKGDTLGAIAKQFYGVTGPKYWNLIQSANKDLIKDVNLIYPGQVFKIPALPEELKKQ